MVFKVEAISFSLNHNKTEPHNFHHKIEIDNGMMDNYEKVIRDKIASFLCTLHAT